MASVLAVVSKAVFEKQARIAGRGIRLGEVWPVDRYVSRNPGLRTLAEGGDLWLVSVRPPDERLWLVAVLRAPTDDGTQWVAAPNLAPVADITGLLPTLRFTSGTGV